MYRGHMSFAMVRSSEMHDSWLYSSPCSMDEIDLRNGPQDFPRDLALWRKAERDRLISDRLAVDADLRSLYSRQIVERLNHILPSLSGLIVSGYWPFRGEPDLRPWLTTMPLKGARAALPVIVAKGKPLEFRLWKSGDTLKRGIWGIPFPAEGATVTPDIVVIPLVGFDRAGFRLGYGGGYFDRTLSVALRKPRVIGVGYSQSRIPTIFPQPHDVPMDMIVTEDEILEFEHEGDRPPGFA